MRMVEVVINGEDSGDGEGGAVSVYRPSRAAAVVVEMDDGRRFGARISVLLLVITRDDAF